MGGQMRRLGTVGPIDAASPDTIESRWNHENSLRTQLLSSTDWKMR
jgi:hypothetical protein